jgi:hypothetical protein
MRERERRGKVEPGNAVRITAGAHKRCPPGTVLARSREAMTGRLTYNVRCGCEAIVRVRSTDLSVAA